MSDNKSTSYGNIFKSTALFGFVQVVSIVSKVCINKVVALVLGSTGMGTIGLYHNAIGMIETGAGLGVPRSAVRDISEANGQNDRHRYSRTISVTNRVIVFTSLLGVVITIILSPFLSKWSFGDKEHTVPFLLLSIVVGMQMFASGQFAILKGLRQLKSLATASLLGSIVGLVSAVPFYFLWGEGGIVPSLFVSAFSSLFFSNLFVRKISYEKERITIKELKKEASPMIKMGVAMMFTTFLGNLAALAVSSFMRYKGGLSDVGLYNAGNMIINGYFGVIITSLTTDYYPRLASVNQNNEKVQDELNKQSLVSLTICCPIVIMFIMLMPFFIQILYSSDFLPIMDFMKIAMFGTLITICSNQVDMILVAKFQTKIFAIISVVYRFIQVALSITLYSIFGLVGMGITLAALGVVHMTIMTIVVQSMYNIHFNKKFVKVGVFVLLLTIASVAVSKIPNLFYQYSLGVLILIISIFYSYNILKKDMGLSIIDYIGRLRRKNRS